MSDPVTIGVAVILYIAMAFASWRIPFLNQRYGDMITMVSYNHWIGYAMFWTMTIFWPVGHLLYWCWLGVSYLLDRYN